MDSTECHNCNSTGYYINGRRAMGIEDKINQAMRLLKEAVQEQQKPAKKAKWDWVDVTIQCTPVLWPSDEDAGMHYVRVYFGPDHVASQRTDGGWYGIKELNPLFRVEQGTKKSSLKIKRWELVE